MAITNPYAFALQVDPKREQDELINLRKDPEQMSKLGLSPDTDFATLKQTDPSGYNRVLSYVKSKVYQSPAYGALASGQSKTEFAQGQLGDFSKNPYQFTQDRTPILETKFNVPNLENAYNDLSAGAVAAPTQIREQVIKKGGYDIPKLTDEYTSARDAYLQTYQDYVAGKVDTGTMARVRSNLSAAQRTLEKAKGDLETETNKGLGNYNQNLNLAKDNFDSAYKRFQDALDLESKGYAQGRDEKMSAAKDMYDFAKELLDKVQSQRDTYQSAMGRVYNPDTGKYEAKPGSGSGATSKLFSEADSLRGDLAKGTVDWGQAWNRLKAQFPTADNKMIDDALGGSGGYNPQTGSFDQNQATGFAKQGPRGEDKNVARTKAFSEMDQDINQWTSDNPGGDPNKLYTLIQQYYPELNDSEIKARMQSKGLYTY